jgi:hypothetical protein
MSTELSNIDIALFALYRLGGVSKKVHTEEIAWEAYQLAKERFSWRLPEFRRRGFPDKTLVYFALGDAKKKKYGKLVTGRAGGDIGGSELEGWRFTPQGVIWIKENEIRITTALKQEVPDLPKVQAERFMKQLKSDSCFKYFQENKNIDEVSQYAFTDMLGCTPDAPKDIIKQKFERLLATAELVNDNEILKFLEECKSKFSSLLLD